MNKQNGFSLVELAIVLVVTSVLSMLVFAANNLIAQAKLQSVISDVKKYSASYHLFHTRYDELPGDLMDESALSWFGVTNPARGGASVEGDGYVDGKYEGPMAFWHMQLADLLDEDYDGSCGADEVPGVDIGLSKLSVRSGFNILTLGYGANAWNYSADDVYSLDEVVVLVLGNIRNGSGHVVPYAALSSGDAHSIDKKIDDGFPNTGDVYADHGTDVGSDNQCVNYAKYANDYLSSDAPLVYMNDNSDLTCRMMFTLKRGEV